MASYTENYGLHQWEATDNFLRTDFNADFGIIDGALGDKAEMMEGSYVGSAQADGETLRSIELPCVPTAIFCSGNPGYFTTGSGTPWGFFLMQGDEMVSGSTTIAKLTGSTLQVANRINAAYLNLVNHVYRYVAFM